jgi:hypothetical protein
MLHSDAVWLNNAVRECDGVPETGTPLLPDLIPLPSKSCIKGAQPSRIAKGNVRDCAFRCMLMPKVSLGMSNSAIHFRMSKDGQLPGT